MGFALALTAALMLTGCSDFKSSLQERDASVWTTYQAGWSTDFQGLKIEISQVSLSEQAPKVVSDTTEGKHSSAIGIHFKLTNTASTAFTTYPTQAKLTTSSGLVLEDPHGTLTDELGGEIQPGATKEGNVVYLLQPGQSTDLTWLQLDWWAKVGLAGDLGTKRENFTAKLELKAGK